MNEEIRELEDEVLEITKRVQDIQAQLANQDRRYPEDHEFAGRRMTDRDYHQWRARAVSALSHSSDDLRKAKADLRDARREAGERARGLRVAQVTNSGSRLFVLSTLSRLAKRAICDYGLTTSPKEQIALDMVQRACDPHPNDDWDALSAEARRILEDRT